MKNKDKKRRGINERIIIFILFVVFFFLIYIGKLVYLQIFDFKNYKQKGEIQSKANMLVMPDRGIIYDRNKNPLAVNVTSDSIYIYRAVHRDDAEIASKIKEDKEQFSKMDEETQEDINMKLVLPSYTDEEVEDLAKILEINKDRIYEMLENGEEGVLVNRVARDQKKKIESMNLGYIRFFTSSSRFYPDNYMLSQTLGFVEDGVGQYGLEKYYNDLLTGEKGYEEFFRAVGGTNIPFEESEKIEEEKAKNLVTTIDENIQKIVYDTLYEYYKEEDPLSITAIVSDPNNGEILAMESLPNFNANHPRDLTSDIDENNLSHLDQDQAVDYMINRWNNPAVSFLYQPGSVFKTVTTAIALESNREIENKSYTCNGSIEIVPGVSINCWRHWKPHGVQTLKQAFRNSCNPAYVQIIWDIGKKDFVDYGRNFKYGMKTGIDLPNEISGQFPANENIKDVDFAPMSYGHSIGTSPIQMIGALNSIVNGGNYYRPHLLKTIEDSNNSVVLELKDQFMSKTLSEKTSKTLREFLENNTNDYPALKKLPLKLGGKTGTTVKVASSNYKRTKDNKKRITTASFFLTYPADAPRYTILVVIDEPLSNSSGDGSPSFAASDIIKKIVEYEDDVVIDRDKIEDLVMIPDLKDKTVQEARNILDSLGLDLVAEDEMVDLSLIDKQFPEAGAYIARGGPIEVEAYQKDRISMPVLIGKDLDEATEILEDSKIKYVIQGQGKKVVNQVPNEKRIISRDDIITLIVE